MKDHNYYNTFISVAEDSKTAEGIIPTIKLDKPTIASMQYEMIVHKPYHFTQEDVLFLVFASRNNLSKSEYKHARIEFFSKGQACLRTSPLCKNYGWGFHFDEQGKVAIYAVDSNEYKKFISNKNLKQISGMKSKR